VDVAHGDGGSVDAGARGSGDVVVTCRHCARPLWREELWGWLHQDDGYLCRDPDTGEFLCTPADPIDAHRQGAG
jgi:hypothetical protein